MASKPSKPTDRQRELNHDRPSATNRAWGESNDPGDQSFGYEGQGGYGDYRTRNIRDSDHAPVGDAPRRPPGRRRCRGYCGS